MNALLCVALTVVVVAAAVISGSSAAVDDLDWKDVNVCLEHKTCGKCIAASPLCSWCQQKEFTSQRCDYPENLKTNNCSSDLAYNPSNSILYYKNDQPRNAESSQDAVQLSPQNVVINLRPNKAFRFPVTFRLAENYPVDLYFLMDVSRTMRSYKDNLVALSDKLADELSKLTKNYRLGLGTFVDKATMPYVSMEQVKMWCTDCAPPYGFRNHLSLMSNISEFRKKVNETVMSGNLDAPEGGFDALMQVIACKKKIGWRSQSRKLIVMSTDATFHYAGDGKLGGIVEPNDGLCHIDQHTGEYTESIRQDYPSISQLSQKVADKKVHIVFAVPQEQVPIYTILAASIEGSSIGVLTSSSSNVVDLIRDNYERISSSIEMKTENSGDLQVTFHSKCLGDILRTTAKCDGLGIGQNVTFDVRLEATSCSDDPETWSKTFQMEAADDQKQRSWSKTFQIYPLGLSEKLTITAFVDCECPCESDTREQRHSAACNGTGTYECGVCVCDDGYYGDRCQCDATSLNADTHDAFCRKDNTSEICQGRGRCECGKCVCNAISQSTPEKHYSGDFCQCSNYNCNYYKGEMCGGPERGQCRCGNCHCKEGFNGTRCECATTVDTCIASNGKLCNEKGVCECGECKCTAENSFYKGPTCEDCPTCPGRCERTNPCVSCHFLPKDDPCYSNCSSFKIDLVDSVHGSDEWHACHVRDDDFCFIHFIYNYKTEAVQVQRTKECRKPVDISLIIMSVVLGILVIGISLLLAWKTVVTIHDRREYARFKQELANRDRWNVQLNPIYREATTTYNNPTFASQQNQ